MKRKSKKLLVKNLTTKNVIGNTIVRKRQNISSWGLYGGMMPEPIIDIINHISYTFIEACPEYFYVEE